MATEILAITIIYFEHYFSNSNIYLVKKERYLTLGKGGRLSVGFRDLIRIFTFVYNKSWEILALWDLSEIAREVCTETQVWRLLVASLWQIQKGKTKNFSLWIWSFIN